MATCPARTRERTVRVGREAQDTRLAKRQRRRLLSAPPQVRILPWCQRLSPSASWPRPPPAQGGDQGSNPCGDAAPVSTTSEVATLSRWRWRGSTAHGYAPESAGWTDRLLSDPVQVRVDRVGVGELARRSRRGRVREPVPGSREDVRTRPP